MASYEADHNLPANTLESSARPTKAKARRPDMSSFYTALAHVEAPNSAGSEGVGPVPADVDSLRSVLLDGLRSMRGDFASPGDDDDETGRAAGTTAGNGGEEEERGYRGPARSDVLDRMIAMVQDQLEGSGERKNEGVSDDFLDGLDRVPKKVLTKGMNCPICGNDFLDDEYPLVVRLPCHKDHIYDLECITPWLKVNPTCPLDRLRVVKEKPKVEPKDDDEEEYDDMFA